MTKDFLLRLTEEHYGAGWTAASGHRRMDGRGAERGGAGAYGV